MQGARFLSSSTGKASSLSLLSRLGNGRQAGSLGEGQSCEGLTPLPSASPAVHAEQKRVLLGPLVLLPDEAVALVESEGEWSLALVCTTGNAHQDTVGVGGHRPAPRQAENGPPQAQK